MAKNTLFVIDPQNDFIDAPEAMGSLAVPGAYEDMKRLASFVENTDLSKIVVSLDTHSTRDIAHKAWWVNEKGEQPSPFTAITLSDFEKGVWQVADKAEHQKTHEYLTSLHEGGKKTLVVWPDHCIANTWGHEVSPVLMQALVAWEKRTGNKVEYVKKGENPNTEHYSAIKAEVVMDAYSDVNKDLLAKFVGSDVVYVAGEAKSHCVADSVKDFTFYSKENGENYRCVLLENCMSPVVGFESVADDFIAWAKKAGVEVENVSGVSKKVRMKS